MNDQILDNQPGQLIIEEYKEKRAYLRHIEDLDLKVIQWYFVVVAGVLAFLYNKADNLYTPLQKEGSIPLLLFLVLYSIFTSIYLILRKRNYNLFVSRIVELEGIYCNFKGDSNQSIFKVYRARLIFVNLLGASCFYLFSYALSSTGLLPSLLFLAYLGILTTITFWDSIGSGK